MVPTNCRKCGRRSHAVYCAALRPRYEASDQRIGGRQLATDEQPDAEPLCPEYPLVLGEGLRRCRQSAVKTPIAMLERSSIS